MIGHGFIGPALPEAGSVGGLSLRVAKKGGSLLLGAVTINWRIAATSPGVRQGSRLWRASDPPENRSRPAGTFFASSSWCEARSRPETRAVPSLRVRHPDISFTRSNAYCAIEWKQENDEEQRGRGCHRPVFLGTASLLLGRQRPAGA